MATSTHAKAQGMVDFLNDVLDKDPAWLSALLLLRAPCNMAIATHPTIQLMNMADQPPPKPYEEALRNLSDMASPEWEAGVLGLLNGLVGTGRRGGALIQGHIGKDGLLTKFELTKAAESLPS